MLEKFTNPKLFAEFGIWINHDKNIFDLSWLALRVKETLEKTNGVLNWAHGLTKSILELAKASPKVAFEIVRLYLLEGGVRARKVRMLFIAENEWFEAIQFLYDDINTKEDTLVLISNLIREGGSMFWKLKEITQKTPHE
jgi:hypothetical protein